MYLLDFGKYDPGFDVFIIFTDSLVSLRGVNCDDVVSLFILYLLYFQSADPLSSMSKTVNSVTDSLVSLNATIIKAADDTAKTVIDGQKTVKDFRSTVKDALDQMTNGDKQRYV